MDEEKLRALEREVVAALERAYEASRSATFCSSIEAEVVRIASGARKASERAARDVSEALRRLREAADAEAETAECPLTEEEHRKLDALRAKRPRGLTVPKED